MSNMKYINFQCDWCGCKSAQKEGNYNRYSNHFCSGSCAQNYRWKEHNKIKEEMLKETVECACGCGEEIPKYNCWGYERKFKNGHASRLSNSGQFKKTETPWNKGLTKEEDERVNYKRPTAFKKGHKAYNKGIPLSEEQKRKLSESLKGRDSWNKGLTKETDERVKKQADKLKGILKPRTEEQNRKLSATIQGITLDEWEGYSSNERQKEWNSKEWQDLRKKIMERDDYTCQECGDHNYKGRGKSIRLEVHHIKEWCNYPDLRMDENNLVLLCVDCHNKTRKGLATKLITNEDLICQA